jgi:Ribosome recycling factor
MKISSVIISPYDENSIDDIVKGIQKSDLGFNPSVDKSVIIINVPPLTQERRAELVKFLGKQTENYRVSLRNIRKESNEGIKKLHKSKEITEDESKKGQSQVQELTDKYIAIINSESASKEEEITKI